MGSIEEKKKAASNNLAYRSITSVSWNALANAIRLIVLMARSIVLARWLPVETFGIYAGANAVIVLSSLIVSFGSSSAFLHRAPETENESEAAAVLLSLRFLLGSLWAIVLVASAFLFTEGLMRTALLLLTATTVVAELAGIGSLMLIRRVVHRRLALIQTVTALLTTTVALFLAYRGVTLWALLATDIVTTLILIIMLYIWRPVWRPRFAWSRSIVHYYLHFGVRSFFMSLLSNALDRLDDLWTAYFLGATPMGFYSRAYVFATYPRQILAAPISNVSSGTYAELKNERQRLAQAFFRTNAFLVRSGFFLAGFFALIAPEFISLILGEKWMPMLAAFRLMLLFTLLDPLKLTVANLFVALGTPETVVRARAVQLGVLVVGLFTLGPSLGITGVALAVDAMLLVGIILLFRNARTYISFSISTLFLAPLLALFSALTLAWTSQLLPVIPNSPWWTATAKGIIFSAVYILILFLLEKEQTRKVILQGIIILRGE